jgi:hypothetical protein
MFGARGSRAGRSAEGAGTAAGRTNTLAAGQGKTVPGAVPLHVAGQNVPCGSPKCQAQEYPESGRQRAGRRRPLVLGFAGGTVGSVHSFSL